MHYKGRFNTLLTPTSIENEPLKNQKL